MKILDKIVADKKSEIDNLSSKKPISVLQDNIRKAATKSKIAFEFLKGDLKIKNEKNN